MKINFNLGVALCFLLTFTGCDRAEIATLQTQISELQNKNADLSSSNLVLQGKILELQAKINSGEQDNAVLRQQLESANTQINKIIETTKANAEQEKIKPIEETIRAFHKFNSTIAASITFDEYRLGLQQLKAILDENSPKIENVEINDNFQNAYANYQDAFIVWGASLKQDIGDYEAALKRHGLWYEIPKDKAADFDKQYASIANLPSALRVTPEQMCNYETLKYNVSPCLQKCARSAEDLVKKIEQKVREQKLQ